MVERCSIESRQPEALLDIKLGESAWQAASAYIPECIAGHEPSDLGRVRDFTVNAHGHKSLIKKSLQKASGPYMHEKYDQCQETGREQSMKVRYSKGIANRPDPESCGGLREDAAEALPGESAGQPLSREIILSGAPTLLIEAEGNTDGDAIRKSSAGSKRSKTLSMRRSSLYRNWEISSVPVEPMKLDGATGGSGKSPATTGA